MLQLYINHDVRNKELLEQEKYYYHSVRGFNLDKLISILAVGILSIEAGRVAGVAIQSDGKAANGTSYVSVSTLLDADSYSGSHLGVIIDPTGLEFFQPRQTIGASAMIKLIDSQYTSDPHSQLAFSSPVNPTFERQIRGKVPKEHIVGITVPLAYAQEDFIDSELFPIQRPELLKMGMDSLEKFYQDNLKVSLLANERLKLAYDAIFAYYNKEKKLEEKLSFSDASKKLDPLKKKIQKEFNLALMTRIKEVYASYINKESYSLVDIIQFHTNLPIYFTNGELVTSNKEEQFKESKKNESL